MVHQGTNYIITRIQCVTIQTFQCQVHRTGATALSREIQVEIISARIRYTSSKLYRSDISIISQPNSNQNCSTTQHQNKSDCYYENTADTSHHIVDLNDLLFWNLFQLDPLCISLAGKHYVN